MRIECNGVEVLGVSEKEGYFLLWRNSMAWRVLDPGAAQRSKTKSVEEIRKRWTGSIETNSCRRMSFVKEKEVMNFLSFLSPVQI